MACQVVCWGEILIAKRIAWSLFQGRKADADIPRSNATRCLSYDRRRRVRPAEHLGRAQPLVREFCQQRELPYCQASLTGSYAQALRHLNAVGKPKGCSVRK